MYLYGIGLWIYLRKLAGLRDVYLSTCNYSALLFKLLCLLQMLPSDFVSEFTWDPEDPLFSAKLKLEEEIPWSLSNHFCIAAFLFV